MSIFQLTLAGLILLVIVFIAIFIMTGVITLLPLGLMWLLSYLNLPLALSASLMAVIIAALALTFFSRRYLKHIPSDRVIIFATVMLPILVLVFVLLGWLITLFMPLPYWAAILLAMSPGVIIGYHFLAHFAGIIYDFLEEW